MRTHEHTGCRTAPPPQTPVVVFDGAHAGLARAADAWVPPQFTTPPQNSTLPTSLELRVITTENVSALPRSTPPAAERHLGAGLTARSAPQLEPYAYKLDSQSSDWVGFVPDFINRLKDFLPDWIE